LYFTYQNEIVVQNAINAVVIIHCLYQLKASSQTKKFITDRQTNVNRKLISLV